MFAAIMGWMEKGERRARGQVGDFVSGPSKGNKVLENGSGGKRERRLQAPRTDTASYFPFPAMPPLPWESSFAMFKTENDSDPSGAERDSRSGQRCLPPLSASSLFSPHCAFSFPPLVAAHTPWS